MQESAQEQCRRIKHLVNNQPSTKKEFDQHWQQTLLQIARLKGLVIFAGGCVSVFTENTRDNNVL